MLNSLLGKNIAKFKYIKTIGIVVNLEIENHFHDLRNFVVGLFA